MRDQYDPHGGRAIGSREMLDSKVAEYGGEMLYINKSARIPLWATEYSRDEGLRKYWDDWSPPFHKDGDGPPHRRASPRATYNRNQDSHAIENVDALVRLLARAPRHRRARERGRREHLSSPTPTPTTAARKTTAAAARWTRCASPRTASSRIR